MAKFSMLTTLLLDSQGYTKGLNAASRATQQMGNNLKESGNALTGVMGKMGGMTGMIGDMAGSLAGAATGVGLVTAAVGILVTALKTAKENMDLYLKSSSKVGMGTLGFDAEAEKLRKETRKIGRGGVRVDQSIITKDFIRAGYLQRQIDKETDEDKKKILQTELAQVLAEYKSAQAQLEINKAFKAGNAGRDAKIALELKFKNLLVAEAKDVLEDMQLQAKWTDDVAEMVRLKTIIIDKDSSAAEKAKASADFETIAKNMKAEKLKDIDEEVARTTELLSLQGKTGELEVFLLQKSIEKADINKEDAVAMMKKEAMENKAQRSSEKQTKELEKQKKLQEDFNADKLKASQQVVVSGISDEFERAKKVRAFEYVNDVAAAKDKYKGQKELNALLLDLEKRYFNDVAQMELENSVKVDDKKEKDDKEALDKKEKAQKEGFDKAQAITEARFANEIITEKEYLNESYQNEVKFKLKTDEELLALEAEKNKKIRELDKETLKTKMNNAQSYLESAATALNSLMDISNASKDNELKAAGKNEKLKEEIEKRYFRKQKALGIAQALINGALAITNLLATVPGSVINPATWIAMGVAAAATAVQVGIIASAKFAKGGIVSSPTQALIGEYAGARSNPEVVAPLSKLTELLGLGGGSEVIFRIEGTQLVGVLDNHNRKLSGYGYNGHRR